MNIDKLENEEHNPVDAQIGKKIKQFRLIQGFTQNELAEKIGVSYQQIQKYENGTNHILVCRLYDLAKALSIDIINFFADMPVKIEDPHIDSSDEGDKEMFMIAREYRKIKSKKSRDAIYSLMKSFSQQD
jgi:transcriptional regulator with XRE-family HTH domain